MKKSLFLLVPAAFGMLTLSACFDESSTSGSSESNQSACSLNPSETGLEITCNNESYGFLKTSSAGVYGSCGAEALRDDSGFKLVCGGDSVGVVYNGKAGRNGVNGDNGLNGQNGENGTSCEAKKVESGFELFCGEKKVGLIPNGHSCTVSKTDGASVISCEDGTEATVLNGINGTNGKNGTNGINGTSCTTSSLKSSDINGTYATITCGTTTVKIYDGAEGEQGEQGEPGENCTVSKNTTTGVTTITCGEYVATVSDGKNGAAGEDGENCTVSKNTTTGVTTITCGDDVAKVYDGENGAAGAKGDAGYSCSATSAVGYSVISCQTGVEDDNPVYKIDTVLAAGYAKCLDAEDAVTGIYNTLTQQCEAGVITPFNCGSTMIDEETQFCENGKAYNKNDYLTAATTYPMATYGKCDDDESDPENVVVGEYYLKASQYCVGTVATEKYQECGGLLYNATTHFCEGTSLYALCGGLTYNPTTEFCAADAKYEKCGGATYDPAAEFCVGTTTYDLATYGPCGDTYYTIATQTCEDDVPTDIDP